ncbi:hypothetical protein HPB47_002534 [Ixodes persulcatus]|uniref:Uncharacterized protein n=1 Tax=Ixodes persulcatus TaxID=34615 RepID=A0AC60PM57_IXOPE|nr:hypothetical protein HPB47_002534 [Ixodes persulcatus]
MPLLLRLLEGKAAVAREFPFEKPRNVGQRFAQGRDRGTCIPVTRAPFLAKMSPVLLFGLPMRSEAGGTWGLAMSAPPPSSVAGPEGACCVGNPRWASAPAVAAALPAPAAATPVAPTPVRSGGHGDQRLVSAARDGDFRKIRRLLQKHRVNVNARDPSTGNTALMVASLVQDPDAMSELLQHGADPTLHSYTGQNCLDSLPGSLVQLVLGFPDYLLRESGDERRLLLAAWSGQRDQVQQLLSQRGSGGLDVNCTNGEGSTPLVLVCRDLATFQELAAAGVLRSYDPLGVIRVLLDHAILIHRDVNHQDRQGRTALHYASHTCCEHTAAVLSLLLQNGAKVDIKDKHGFSPLHFAGQAGSVDAVQLLLDAGADPSATGLGAIAPLHLAASAGKTAAVRLLLERGADVLSFAQDGKSPLCCAGSTDVYSVLRRAVESALCDRADQLRLSPLDQAAACLAERQQPGQPGLPSADQSSPGSSTTREEGSSSGEPSEPEAGPPAPSAFRRYRAPGWRQKSPHGGSHFVRDRWACPEGSLDSYHRHGTMPCHSSLEPAPEAPSRPETGERARPGAAEVADCTPEAGAESPAPEADRARAVGTGRDAYARVRPRNAPDSESGDEERRQSLRRRPVGSRRKKPHHHANKSYHLSRLKLRPEPVSGRRNGGAPAGSGPRGGPPGARQGLPPRPGQRAPPGRPLGPGPDEQAAAPVGDAGRRLLAPLVGLVGVPAFAVPRGGGRGGPPPVPAPAPRGGAAPQSRAPASRASAAQEPARHPGIPVGAPLPLGQGQAHRYSRPGRVGGPPLRGFLPYTGKGAFGLVWCGLRKPGGELVAVKQFQLSGAEVLSAVQLEVDILQSLKHPNIVGFLGVQQHEGAVNLFLELVSGGSLAANLAQFGPFPESVVRRYGRQLLQALAYLHQRNVLHRDIKGNNVMVCPGSGTIKLIDFGCATFEPSSADCEALVASARGTPYWMAPEVICQQECSHRSDVWSVGCTVIEMFQTKPPWYELSPLAAAFAIGQGTSDPKFPEQLGADARDFILACLKRSPSERPTAEELLGHRFLQTGAIEDL